MTWFLRDDVAKEMTRATSVSAATPDQIAAFGAHCGPVRADGEAPRNMRVAGDVAEVSIDGVLTERPSFLAWLLYGGGTTYESIRSSLAMADADPRVKRIVLRINSPGGTVDGLFETIAAIQATTKPMSVVASMATSAAYALAAVAGKIEAVNRASEFGSIGVVQSIHTDESTVQVTSTDAPKKRPDVTTEEGKAVVREHLDAIHELFVEAIANGRGTRQSVINAEFGRGAVLLADDAKKRGMIDRVAKQNAVARVRAQEEAEIWGTPEPAPQIAAAAGGAQKKEGPMTKEELKSQHPALYAAVHNEGKAEGSVEGRDAGVKAERDRVNAHLELGQASGDTETAFAAIREGTEMTQTIQAKYMAASMRRGEQVARQSDSDTAAAAIEGAAVASGEDRDLGDEVMAALDAKKGKVL
jgi:ClpP class serine protease